MPNLHFVREPSRRQARRCNSWAALVAGWTRAKAAGPVGYAYDSSSGLDDTAAIGVAAALLAAAWEAHQCGAKDFRAAVSATHGVASPLGQLLRKNHWLEFGVGRLFSRNGDFEWLGTYRGWDYLPPPRQPPSQAAGAMADCGGPTVAAAMQDFAAERLALAHEALVFFAGVFRKTGYGEDWLWKAAEELVWAEQVAKLVDRRSSPVRVMLSQAGLPWDKGIAFIDYLTRLEQAGFVKVNDEDVPNDG